MSDGEEDDGVIEPAIDEEDEPLAQESGDEGAEPSGEVNDELDGELVAEIEGDDEAEGEAEGEAETEGEKTLANKLRRLLRDSEREKLAIERENEALKTTAAPKPIEVGPKPDLWEDSDGDQDAHDEKILAWHQRKADADNAAKAQTDAQEAAKGRVANAVLAMRAKAVEVGLKNYDEAELAVAQTLAPSLAESIPLLLGDQAASLVQILYNNPALIEKINKTVADDPHLGLAAGLVELTRLSMRIKMPVPRKSNAQAEEIVRGSASVSHMPANKQREKLERDADAGKPGAAQALQRLDMAQRKASRQAA